MNYYNILSAFKVFVFKSHLSSRALGVKSSLSSLRAGLLFLFFRYVFFPQVTVNAKSLANHNIDRKVEAWLVFISISDH